MKSRDDGWVRQLALLTAIASLVHAQGPEPAGGEVLPAEFRWAQRKDRILLTIELQGVRDEKFEVTSDGRFRFEGSGSYRDRREQVDRYAVDLQVPPHCCCPLVVHHCPASIG
jgi:hypothetical protein